MRLANDMEEAKASKAAKGEEVKEDDSDGEAPDLAQVDEDQRKSEAELMTDKDKQNQ